jgi:hypothetical protein
MDFVYLSPPYKWIESEIKRLIISVILGLVNSGLGLAIKVRQKESFFGFDKLVIEVA